VSFDRIKKVPSILLSCQKEIAHATVGLRTDGKEIYSMSQHPSFGQRGKIRAKKNVLPRYDRIQLLKKKGKWKEGDSVFGLPKTKPE